MVPAPRITPTTTPQIPILALFAMAKVWVCVKYIIL